MRETDLRLKQKESSSSVSSSSGGNSVNVSAVVDSPSKSRITYRYGNGHFANRMYLFVDLEVFLEIFVCLDPYGLLEPDRKKKDS